MKLDAQRVVAIIELNQIIKEFLVRWEAELRTEELRDIHRLEATLDYLQRLYERNNAR